ncbi:MAG TPA: DUF4349 domain-containing protein [Polyangiaceae bacterium]|nr:DUF4349 domain-containing protein [Polyangiaceae bacterium]
MAHRKYLLVLGVFALLAWFTAGCQRRAEPSAANGASKGAVVAATGVAPAVPKEDSLRQVIRKAEMQLEVAAPSRALSRATEIAERHGGFVANTATNSGQDAGAVVSLTLRVPAGHFTRVLEELRALGSGASMERVSSEDVSDECLDLEARIKTQRALEQQFLEILKRAEKVEDALKVERELATVRAEIERLDGRRKFLAREVALSTIDVSLTQERALVSASWRSLGDAARHAYADAIDNAAGLVELALRVIGALLPIALLLGAPAAWGIRHLRRKRAVAR